jgi:LAGLIDADG endonuclease
LINIILPIFNYVQLNSSKYSQFKVFEEAVKLLKDKSHLTIEGKKKMTDFKKRLNKDYKLPDFIYITDAWLVGFIEGEGSFSTSGLKPRLKFENHIKEFKLLQEIQKFFGFGSLIIKTRKDRGLNENPTAVLEITKISTLLKFVSKYNNKNSDLFSFKTKKYYDFKDWSIIVNLYYLGYHLLPEGKSLIIKIKSGMNNYRLSTNTSLNNEENFENLEIEINKVFALAFPYEIKNGIRLYSGTNKWVSDKISIIVIDNLGNELYFDSLTNCSLSLKISRSKIKDSIVKGIIYKNFLFKLNVNAN